MRTSFEPNDKVLLPLLLPSATSIFLLLCRVILTESSQFLFLQWNLILAWLPLVWAWLLMHSLKRHSFSDWQPVLFGILWVLFLPNSFYLVSDFVHLEEAEGMSMLFDAVMLLSFSLSGLIIGWVSVYIVQELLERKLARQRIRQILVSVFLLCSFAVYLGRFLGWNSWDVVFNPADILFDVSDRVLNPALYPNTFITTSLFFIFIASSYAMFRSLIDAVRNYK